MEKLCEGCGTPIVDALKANRRYCSDLCGKRTRRRNAATGAPARVVPPPVTGASDLLDSVKKTLEAAGRLDTSMGQLALVLAQKMTDYGTGSGIAAISRELSRVMAAALQSAEPADDPLDELRRRRDMKRSRR
jgi:hypothetical protein